MTENCLNCELLVKEGDIFKCTYADVEVDRPYSSSCIHWLCNNKSCMYYDEDKGEHCMAEDLPKYCVKKVQRELGSFWH